MSRSKPTDNAPNPSTRWHEWNGATGAVKYYDKEAKTTVTCPPGFTFVLLDVLAVVKGWHDASDSGISSNEVRDVRSEPLTVKAFKGGVIANGLYTQIRDAVLAAGGHYTSNLYIAYRDGGQLRIGSLQFKGAALGGWMEFQKANRKAVFEQAIKITGCVEGKKGQVVFKVPTFGLVGISEGTQREAIALDAELQQYLDGYFRRTIGDKVEAPTVEAPEDYIPPPPPEMDDPAAPKAHAPAIAPKDADGNNYPISDDVPF